jgi:hypothetical protein
VSGARSFRVRSAAARATRLIDRQSTTLRRWPAAPPVLARRRRPRLRQWRGALRRSRSRRCPSIRPSSVRRCAPGPSTRLPSRARRRVGVGGFPTTPVLPAQRSAPRSCPGPVTFETGGFPGCCLDKPTWRYLTSRRGSVVSADSHWPFYHMSAGARGRRTRARRVPGKWWRWMLFFSGISFSRACCRMSRRKRRG